MVFNRVGGATVVDVYFSLLGFLNTCLRTPTQVCQQCRLRTSHVSSEALHHRVPKVPVGVLFLDVADVAGPRVEVLLLAVVDVAGPRVEVLLHAVPDLV